MVCISSYALEFSREFSVVARSYLQFRRIYDRYALLALLPHMASCKPPPRLLLIPLSPTTSLRNTGRVRTTQEKENEGTCTTHASSQQRQHNRGDGRQSIYYGVVQYSLWYLVPVEVCYPDLTPGRPTTCIPTSLRNTSQR